MLEADGNMQELNAPYGGHMGAICLPYGSRLFAIWELCVSHMGAILHHMGAKLVPTVRQIRELCAPYGATCAVWELLAPYGSHMEALRAIWKPCVPHGSHVAPC
jgi:hypothetical protein